MGSKKYIRKTTRRHSRRQNSRRQNSRRQNSRRQNSRRHNSRRHNSRRHNSRRHSRRQKYTRKTKRRRSRTSHKGGGCLDIYPLSSYGGAVGGPDPYFGQNGGWQVKNVSGRNSIDKITKKKSSKRKRRSRRTMRGGSAREPIIGSELQQGLYSIWNTGETAYNTWNGVKSPFSLDASPLNQPVDLT